MFYPLPSWIALRYVRSRQHGFFVSFISWVSMLGVCLGVAALIVVLSVMNGFESELRGRLLNLSSHATLSGSPAQLRNWQVLADRARSVKGVTGVAPYVGLQGMVGRGGMLAAAQLRGVLPEEERQVSDIGASMVSGDVSSLQQGAQHIVLGAGLAWQLQAQMGDEISVLIPETVAGTTELRPRLQTFTVSGIFEIGAAEYDNTLALIHLEDAAALAGTDGAPTGLRLRFQDIFAAPTLVKQVAARLQVITDKNGGKLVSSDWSVENASYFRAVRIEKTMMSLMLMLIVAIAAFNIVGALVMVVNEKRTDIAILRTVGLSPNQVVAVFMTQGLIIGWFGILLGLLLGLTLAFNVQTIVPFLEQGFGFRFFDPSVYYITQIPSEVHGSQVLVIALIALLLTAAATIYPARRGARVAPAEALRYE